MKGYALKNKDILTYDIFPYRRNAVERAKYLISNHPDIKWKDAYQIVKVEITELASHNG